MRLKPKELNEQVIVITGASSGIGLTTARMAAKRGARLVLAARNREALEQLTNELDQSGHQVVCVVADVGVETDVQNISRVAREHFGGFDTWVNNAASGIYGRLSEIRTEDHRKIFETNFWGVVYGSLEAVKHLRNDGGTLINIGSALADRAIPLQGMYATSKHAVKGFTDALRVELEAEGAPVVVTLIKPSSIDTPYPQRAKNYMREEPTLPPPVYTPQVVAEAILHCAVTPKRDLTVGSGGKLISFVGQRAPRLTDKAMATNLFFGLQRTNQPARSREGALYTPTTDLEERGQYQGYVRKSSLYTWAGRQRLGTAIMFAATGLALVALLRGDRILNGSRK